ncbi:MAG: UDP-N-acetylmuramate--L-alanine ligase [Planctomycetota bacterium]
MHLQSGSRIHLTGIGGCATSGLAHILAALGHQVSGSDRGAAASFPALREHGVVVHAQHDASNVPAATDLLVYSLAVPPTNPELEIARQRGIPTIAYPKFLGQLLAAHRGVAIAGTHGKTSTAALLATLLVAGGADPSFLIGGTIPGLGGNWRCGNGGDFLVEACEYRRSFHNFQPDIGVITNIERDHPEIYPDDESVVLAFEQYVGGFQRGGLVVVNGDSPKAAELPTPAGGRKLTYGFRRGCDWRAELLAGGASPRFRVSYRGDVWGEIALRIPGRHNVSNALAAVAVAVELGVAAGDVIESAASFTGVDRRFQCFGAFRGVDLVEDYAHHPTEVNSVIDTARDKFPKRRLWALFQPHQLGRLDAFGRGFADALAAADRVALVPTYSVRESAADFPTDLLERLENRIARETPVHRFGSLEESVDAMPELLDSGDVCLVLGAGDVSQVTVGLRNRLEGV